MLGHPQADIGRTGNDGGLGFGFQQVGEIVDIGRDDEAVLASADLDAGAVPQLRQTRDHGLSFDLQRVLCRLAVAGDGARRPHDRLIAGAAAEIALQRLFDFGVGRFGRPHPQRIERHDKARRTETALRAVEIDHRPLHGVQLVGLAGQMLDGDDVAGVERAHEADAGIHALIDQLAGDKLANQNRTGAAIPFGAAFLRAFQRTRQAQPVEQRLVGRDIGQRDIAAVEDEAQLGAGFQLGHALSFPCRSSSCRARPAAARDNVWFRPCQNGSG